MQHTQTLRHTHLVRSSVYAQPQPGIVESTAYSTQYTVYNTQHPVYGTQYTVYSTQYTVYTQYTVQYTVHIRTNSLSSFPHSLYEDQTEKPPQTSSVKFMVKTLDLHKYSMSDGDCVIQSLQHQPLSMKVTRRNRELLTEPESSPPQQLSC